MKVRRLDSLDALEPLVPAWERLAAAAEYPLPFSSPHWLLPWWRHFSRHNALLSDALRTYVFEGDDGELLGIAPLNLTSRPARGPLRLRQLQVLGADPNITELNPLLCRPGHDAEVHRALFRALEGEGGWEQARWWVPQGSGAEAALGAEPRVTWAGERPMFLLEPGPSWDAFKSSRSRNVKESLRKCYNSLARDGHRFVFHVRKEPHQLPRAMDRFFALHRERAQATDTIAHPDWFASTTAKAFLCEVMYRFAAQGHARVFELELGGTIVSSRLAFVVGETIYFYFTGYQSDWGRYSVMTTTTAEAMQAAIREGLKTINLSFGRDGSKTRWGPREVLYRGAVQQGATLRARGFDLLEPRVRRALEAPGLKAVRSMLTRAGT